MTLTHPDPDRFLSAQRAKTSAFRDKNGSNGFEGLKR